MTNVQREKYVTFCCIAVTVELPQHGKESLKIFKCEKSIMLPHSSCLSSTKILRRTIQSSNFPFSAVSVQNLVKDKKANKRCLLFGLNGLVRLALFAFGGAPSAHFILLLTLRCRRNFLPGHFFP